MSIAIGPYRTAAGALVASRTYRKEKEAAMTIESSPGFVQYKRSQLADEINRDYKAFAILGLIARRARRRNEPNEFNLEAGECLLGCNDSAGLTREEYRGALRRLKGKWRQIETRPFRGGSRGKKRGGTIVKLISTDVFDINVDTNFRKGAEIQPSRKPPRIIGETGHQQPLKQPLSNHRATIEQPLTNNEIRKEEKNDDIKACGNSLAGEQPSSHPSSFSVFECYQNHIKWPEFVAYAKRLGKPPTAEWFKRWLVKQKPQWRTKKSPRQEVLEELGYTLDGKFYPSAEANGLAMKDPNLIEKFRTATRRNGKVVASKCSRATSR